MPEPTKQPKPGSIGLVGMQAALDSLRTHAGKLQQKVDQHGREWLEGLPANIGDADAAATAMATYDLAWFRESMYSTELQADIADALIELTDQYPFGNKDAWKKISGARQK